MKKSTIIILGVVLVLGLVTTGLVLSNSSDEDQSIEQVTQETQNNESTDNSATEPVAVMESPDTMGLGYVEYSDDNLAEAAGSTRIVFFHAPWCSVCNFYEGQIEEQGVPEGVSILKVDFDSEDELKERYGVTVQSTFVLLDEQGNVVETWPFARGLNGIQDLYDAVI